MSPLDTIVSDYPHFLPNQVLRSDHLNDLFDYLDQQTRLSRQQLTGIGIVCGLEVSLARSPGAATIGISGGVGITSEGFLISIGPRACTHFRPYTPDGYPPFQGFANVFELLETPDDDTDPDVAPLGDAVNTTRIVVLLLEKADRQTNICLDDSCDRKGVRQELTIRALLVERSDIDAFHTTVAGSRRTTPGVLLTEYDLPRVTVPRVRSEDGNLDKLSPIRNFDTFLKAHFNPIVLGGKRLREALDALYSRFKPLIDRQLGTNSSPFGGLDPEDMFNRAVGEEIPVQYVCDWIGDIADAYEDLRHALFDLVEQCRPDPRLFPCHLSLGQLRARRTGSFDSAVADLRDPYRNRFIPSPALDHGAKVTLNVKQLVQRLVLIIDRFLADALREFRDIRITPTEAAAAPLGDRAIPFYYDVARSGPELLQSWNFRTALRGESDTQLSYHASDYATDPAALAPLVHDIARFPALRIEGHQGWSVLDAANRLIEMRQVLNLDFDIIALNIDDASTTVFLPDDTKIADLQTLYLTHRNAIVCCARELLAILRKFLASRDIRERLLKEIQQISRQSKNAGTIAFFADPAALESLIETFARSAEGLADALPPDLKALQPAQFQVALDAFGALASAFQLWRACLFSQWKTRLASASGWKTSTDVLKKLDDRFPEMFQRLEKEGADGFQSSAFVSLGAGTRAASTAMPFACAALELIGMQAARLSCECAGARFETIHRALAARLAKLSSVGRFDDAHPGMEHIAGTHRGGTFILVYRAPEAVREVPVKVRDPSNKLMRRKRIEIDTGPDTQIAQTGEDGVLLLRLGEQPEDIWLNYPGYDSIGLKAGDIPPDVRFNRQTTKGAAFTAKNAPNRYRRVASSALVMGEELRNRLLESGLADKLDSALLRPMIPGIDAAAPPDETEEDAVKPAYPTFRLDAGRSLTVIADFTLRGKLPDNHFETAVDDLICRPGGVKPGVDFNDIFAAALGKFNQTLKAERS